MAEEKKEEKILTEEESDTESDPESEPDNRPNPTNPRNPSSGEVTGERRGTAGGGEDARRLFQRLWTDEEELVILRGFLDFTAKRGTTFASHQYDTGPFYEEIRRRLTLDFSKNQLIEKLRRLKKKYRNCAGRIKAKGKGFSFRSPHEQAVFEIAGQIWRPARNSGGISGEDDVAVSSGKRNSRSRHRNRRKFQQNEGTITLPIQVPVPQVVPVQTPVQTETKPSVLVPVHVPVPTVPVASSSESSGSVIEETVRTCLSPLFRELIGTAIGTVPVGLQTLRTVPIGLQTLGTVPVGLQTLGTVPAGLQSLGVVGTVPIGLQSLGPVPVCPKISDEKWRQQYALELEVYLRRIELVKEQVLCALEELRKPKS